MKIPQKPPTFEQLTKEAGDMGRIDKVLSVSRIQNQSDYLHWDKLRRKTPPVDLNNKELWLATKLSRLGNLIRHALKHPGFRYTIQGHKKSHNVAYQTARTDLLSLVDNSLFEFRKIGKALTFIPQKDLPDTLLKLERESAASQLDLKSL